MDPEPYAALAAVYEWLVPDALLEPEGAVAAFADVVDTLASRARVLDCAAGTGQLAVGLALRGFDVVAADASDAMLARTRDLAARRGVDVPTVVCEWAHLGQLGSGAFDAVFCVGNSLAHAEGRRGRRAAFEGMHSVLRTGGLVTVTSRNWERVRVAGSGLQLPVGTVSRGGRRGLVVRAWDIAARWADPHHLEVAVLLLGGDGEPDVVSTHAERLAFWPFRHGDLLGDLRACGFVPDTDAYDPGADRYLVTARRDVARDRPQPAGGHTAYRACPRARCGVFAR